MIEVLAVADCPNVSVLIERVRQILGENVRIDVRVLNPGEPIPRGFAGSPTLLIDGANPFVERDPDSGPACRLQIPTTDELCAILRSE